MKVTHLGYEIICEQRISWDGKITSNYLKITRKATPEEPEYVHFDMWWDQKMKKGIDFGIKMVEQHRRAMTVRPGQG